MITYNNLIHRLNKINFSEKPTIKFSFDIESVFESLKNKDFSEPTLKMCMFDYKNLIMQDDIYKNIPNELLTAKSKKGICILTSLYNAYPFLFNNDINLFSKFVIDKLNLKFYSLEQMSKEINMYKKHKYLNFDKNNLINSYILFKENILQNKPVVVSYIFNRPMYMEEDLGQHTITLLGYDDNFIYYKENSVENYLFTSLIIYISRYYKFNGIKETNPEYKRLTELINEPSNEKCEEIAKGILGYNIGKNGVSMLKKEFLTNDKYFYDLNRFVTYTEEIPIPEDFDNDTPTNFSVVNMRTLVH